MMKRQRGTHAKHQQSTQYLCLTSFPGAAMLLSCRRWRLAVRVGALRLVVWLSSLMQDVTTIVLPPMAA
jgi:hypothetical protein